VVLKKSDIPSGSCGILVSPLLSQRHLAPLASLPFHKILPEQRLIQPQEQSAIRVAFFVGCLLDKVFPKVAIDIVRVLTAHGFDVIIPPDQGCCGIPALAAGDQASFQRLAAHHLDRFDPGAFDYLVTGCATCTATIKEIWPAMVKAASPDQTAALAWISEKTYDVMQFLVEVAGVRPTVQNGTPPGSPIITYHDPCHLRKTLNVATQPRAVILASGAGAFVEMPEAASCCGMGGSFNLAHYDLSTAIGEKKVAGIEASGASIVATGCPACMIQLADMLARQKKQVRVAHVMELYAENISELAAPGTK
jgi:glycolate oxidase iron-sulfur subunit